MATDTIIYQYNGYALSAAWRVIKENIVTDPDEPDSWKKYLCDLLDGEVKVTVLGIGKPTKPRTSKGFTCLWIPVHVTYEGGEDERRRLRRYTQDCLDDESGFYCDACGLASDCAPHLNAE